MKSKPKTEQMKTASMVANPRHAYAHNRLLILNARLGEGVGATRERKRLAAILAKG